MNEQRNHHPSGHGHFPWYDDIYEHDDHDGMRLKVPDGVVSVGRDDDGRRLREHRQ